MSGTRSLELLLATTMALGGAQEIAPAQQKVASHEPTARVRKAPLTPQQILEAFMSNPVDLEIKTDHLPDPLTAHTVADRTKYMHGLVATFADAVEVKAGKGVADAVREIKFVYDPTGEKAVAHALKELIRDTTLLGTHANARVKIGRKEGSLAEVSEWYVAQRGKSVTYAFPTTRHMVPFSVALLEDDQAGTVYALPFWFKEVQSGKRGTLNAQERHYVMASDVGHELVHALRKEAGFSLQGERLTVSNDGPGKLNVPREYYAGLLHLAGERNGTSYQETMLRQVPHLSRNRANHHFCNKTKRQFNDYAQHFPRIKQLVMRRK